MAARFWWRLAAELGGDVQERMRPVPDKPHIPDDVILSSTPHTDKGQHAKN